MRIGKAAKIAGVSVETVRFYERQGLISQPSRPVNGGYRSYPSETVGRIRFIRQAQILGFSLKEIDELLSLRADPSTDCADIRVRVSMKLEDEKVKIARLVAIQSAFRDLVSACPGRGVAARYCPILVALETHEINGVPDEANTPPTAYKGSLVPRTRAKPVIAEDTKTGKTFEFSSGTAAAAALGVHRSAISQVISGKVKSAKGYRFRFAK